MERRKRRVLVDDMRIGVLGGTFDPPHIGHLVIAEAARSKLGLSTVYFIPARQPPHKLDQPVTLMEHRLAMLRLALGDNPFFTLSLVEADRPGPSYTVDTIRELGQESPTGTEIFFIEGTDSLAALPTWHRPAELIQLCKLAVLQRPGYRADMQALQAQFPGIRSRVVFIHSPELSLSSHELQDRCRAGRPLKYLVPDGVADYIAEHTLYR
ncbi:MAG: nicotinate-nucleotide adenylyltransferase [Anaerolineae bacterium]